MTIGNLITTHSNTRSSSALALWLSAAVLTLTGVAPSHAQQPAGNARTFISINGGLQALTGSFSESVDFPESGGVYREVLSAAAAQEQARFESDYRYRTGALFDVSGGVRIAPYFALGAGISWFNTEKTASVSVQLPHPLYFNRTRSISGVSSPLTRSEMAVHLQAYVVVPATNSLTVMGFTGPTFFNVKQQLVTDVNFVHAYPFDTATFSSAAASTESTSTIGFNVGADVTYYFTDHVGIGWFTRYSRSDASLESRTHEYLAQYHAGIPVPGVAPSHAQQPAGNARTFISINGGLQALTGSFSESVDFPESGGVYREVLSGAAAQEQARFESNYRYRTGALFDVSGGVRIAPYFALGAGISWFNTEKTASVSAQLPHPLYFNRTRSISGVSSPLTRSEMAVHLQAYVVVPATNSLTVMGFAGPTFFNVKQQLVTDVNFVHAYPFDTATFSSAAASTESASTIGFNVGADVTYYFTDHVGIGWFTRYSRATLKLPSAGNGTLDIKPGGLHAAGGLRLRF